MRAVNLVGLLIVGIGLVVIAPEITTGQQPGGRKGGGGGGGGDPNKTFDYLAQGKTFFLMSAVRRDPQILAQYAQEKGITNGQITRQQYLDFVDWREKNAPAGTGPGGFGGKGGFKGNFGGNMQPPGGAPAAPPSPEVIAAAAKVEFDSYDRNKDGVLDQNEISGFLRKDLAKWDKNGDGLIDFNEYKEYYAARMTARMQGNADDPGRNGPASIIIQEEDLDAKPIVFRAGGTMPAGLPAWFKDLDTDGDGQIAPYEWRKAGKSMDEFANWDLNGDGFITPEEALKQQSIIAKNTKSSPGNPGNSVASGFNPGAGSGNEDPRKAFFNKRPGGDNGGGFPFGGNKGQGGFGKGKKGGKDRGDKSTDP